MHRRILWAIHDQEGVTDRPDVRCARVVTLAPSGGDGPVHRLQKDNCRARPLLVGPEEYVEIAVLVVRREV